MEQERNVITLDLQIALVDFRRERQSIQLSGVQLRTRRVVDDFAVLPIADPQNFAGRLSLREFDNGMIELPLRDEIDVFAGVQRLFRLVVTVGTHEGDFEVRLRLLDLANQLDVASEAHGGGEEDQKFVVFRNFNRLLPIHLMRRGVEKTAAGEHSSGIGEPDRVPVGLYLTGRGPPRAGSAVEVFEAGWIQQ